MAAFEDVLRKLAVRDDALVESILRNADSAAPSGLDRKTWAIVQLGAMVSVNGSPPSYMDAAEAALRAGATHADLVGVLIAIMPVVGVTPVVTAAPKLALALGYDVDAALERPRNPL